MCKQLVRQSKVKQHRRFHEGVVRGLGALIKLFWYYEGAYSGNTVNILFLIEDGRIYEFKIFYDDESLEHFSH